MEAAFDVSDALPLGDGGGGALVVVGGDRTNTAENAGGALTIEKRRLVSPEAADCYPRALEMTVKSQQVEIERGRARAERAAKAAVAAERREEAVKTELINARSEYALRLAEVRAACAADLEAKCEARCADGKRAAARAEEARDTADAALRAARTAADVDRAAAVDRAASDRALADAALAAADARADAARAMARKHEKRAGRLVHAVVVLAAVAAGLGLHAVSGAPRKLARREGRIATLEAAARAAAHGEISAKSDCKSALANVSSYARHLVQDHYLCVSLAQVGSLVDLSHDAARTCGA